ncbi:hypothetical protein SLE2022_202370 [Rubroshorea leprosula]
MNDILVYNLGNFFLKKITARPFPACFGGGVAVVLPSYCFLCAPVHHKLKQRLKELNLANCKKVMDIPCLQSLESLRSLFLINSNACPSAVKTKRFVQSKYEWKQNSRLVFPRSSYLNLKKP